MKYLGSKTTLEDLLIAHISDDPYHLVYTYTNESGKAWVIKNLTSLIDENFIDSAQLCRDGVDRTVVLFSIRGIKDRILFYGKGAFFFTDKEEQYKQVLKLCK